MHANLLTTLLLTASSLVASSAIHPKYLPLLAYTPIGKRDLPVDHGCQPCPGGDGFYYAQAQRMIAAISSDLIVEGKASFGQTFPAGYRPKLCNAHGINCMTSDPGVRWTETGGLSGPMGRWARTDGTETIAWARWQSTLQWVGAGGSATTYNAHCTILLCAKGKMQAKTTTEGVVQGDGTANNAAPNNCECMATPDDETALDADITFSLL